MRLTYIFTSLRLILRCIAIVILAPVAVAIYYGDYSSIAPFVTPALISIVLSFIFKPRSNTFDSLNDIKKSEALCVVALSWILFAIISMIPYLYYGLNPINSLFESVSGITTTGASILTHYNYPKAMFFWRSMSQWLGGMGIIVLFIAILPQFAVAGRQMFFAEATGPTEDKMTPRIRHTATAVWTVYIILTAIEVLLLKIAGMPWFDAVCNSFSTLAGGGFSPNAISTMGYHSTAVCWIMTLFLFFAGMNFALMYKIFVNKKISFVFKDEEFMTYGAIVLGFSLILGLVLYFVDSYNLVDSATNAFYQVCSIMSTAGSASADFALWSLPAKMLLFLLLFCGSCSGSAGGGLKVIRWIILFKYMKKEIAQILHPNAVYPIKINKTIIPNEVIKQIIGFVLFYFAIFSISAIVISLLENNALIGVTGSIATLGNSGPGLGAIGPMGSFDFMHPVSKMICIFNMMVGRLELIPFLAMLHPDFWNLK